jgi:hypothetical protein
VLKAVIKGDITTAEAFQTQLAEKPLSGHFTVKAPPPPPPPGGCSRVLAMALVLLLLIAGAGTVGVLWLMGIGPFAKPTETSAVASNTPTGSNTVTSGTKTQTKPATTSTAKRVETNWRDKPTGKPPADLDALLSEFDQTKDPKRRVELLAQMYALYAKLPEPDQNAIRPWIEYCRGVYGSDWVKRYHAADNSLQKPATRLDGAKKINELNQELAGLRQKCEPISPSLNQRETQCLEVSGLRATELGSRR